MSYVALEFPALCAISTQLLFDCFGYPGIARDGARPNSAGRVDSLERLRRKSEVDPVQGANRRHFRIRQHGATLAPGWLGVHGCFYFVPGTRLSTLISSESTQTSDCVF